MKYSSLVLVLIIGLVLGYIVYPKVNRSAIQTPELPDATTTRQSDWKTFADTQSGISFDYPASWAVNRSSQIFENGDVVVVEIVGETQQQNTEFYDGARLVVMVPVVTALDLQSWVKSQYTANDQISDTTINGKEFKKIYTCGLGCFTYYYTMVGEKVYGINVFAEGPKKAEYEAAIDQILKTFKLPNE